MVHDKHDGDDALVVAKEKTTYADEGGADDDVFRLENSSEPFGPVSTGPLHKESLMQAREGRHSERQHRQEGKKRTGCNIVLPHFPGAIVLAVLDTSFEIHIANF